MENKNRPTGRKRNVTGKADPIKKKEQGLGTGPVGTGRPGGLPNQPHPGGIPNQPQQPGRAAQTHRTEPIHETRPSSTGRYVKRGGGALSRSLADFQGRTTRHPSLAGEQGEIAIPHEILPHA